MKQGDRGSIDPRKGWWKKGAVRDFKPWAGVNTTPGNSRQNRTCKKKKRRLPEKGGRRDRKKVVLVPGPEKMNTRGGWKGEGPRKRGSCEKKKDEGKAATEAAKGQTTCVWSFSRPRPPQTDEKTGTRTENERLSPTSYEAGEQTFRKFCPAKGRVETGTQHRLRRASAKRHITPKRGGFGVEKELYAQRGG